MVRRGWRNLLYLKYAAAKAKAKRPLHLGKAAPSGTIENVGCELPPETKQRNLQSGIMQYIPCWDFLPKVIDLTCSNFQNLRLDLDTTTEVFTATGRRIRRASQTASGSDASKLPLRAPRPPRRSFRSRECRECRSPSPRTAASPARDWSWCAAPCRSTTGSPA